MPNATQATDNITHVLLDLNTAIFKYIVNRFGLLCLLLCLYG